MKAYLSYPLKYLLLLLLTFTLQAGAETAAVSKSDTMRLAGHIPTKAMTHAVCLNRLEAETQVPMTFILPLRNPEKLQDLINRIHDPADPQYGKYLTSKEFNRRYAPTKADYDNVIAYAESLGLTVSSFHPNRMLLNVSGSASSVESAFNLNLHRYQLPSGRTFYAPNNNPEVPSTIASVIGGIVGLDNHARWHTYNRLMPASASLEGSRDASQAFPSGPNGGFAPSDIAKAYNLTGVQANGSKQVIALFELADYQESDITAYTNQFGLPAPKLNKILVDGGSSSGIDPEVTLDIELAIALAPQSQIYVYEGPNSDQGVLDTYNRIATDNLAKQVSTSWGEGEDLLSVQYLQAENAIFQQMAAQGQTIYAAAGDSGAYDDYANNQSTTLVVDDPASQPYVVGVGGTTLTVDASSGVYVSELVWNDGVGNGAGGGGVSTVWPIPLWQQNVSTVFSNTYRNVPDVTLNADPNTGYAIFYSGQWQIYGGTSCAAPLWAAFTACVNQELEAAQKPSLGFANPALYTLCGGTSYTAFFHDVKTGNNLYYKALTGYDNASGWGSFNGGNLFAKLTNSGPLLNILMKHNAAFTKGGTGSYHLVVSNCGNSSTSGPVKVTITLPTGLSYNSFSGSGWVYSDNNTFTFTENTNLLPEASYPTILLTVNVDANAPYTVIPTATVSGGGGTDSYTVTNLTTCR